MNNSFLIRWQGRVTGPTTQEEIERRLATNEIGMLHEIQFNGEWMTIRMFLDLKSAEEKAKRTRLEEEDRQAREEMERQARQQAEKLDQAKLLQLRRQNELLEQQSSPPPDPMATSPSVAPSGLRNFGAFFLIVGLAVVAYFYFVFDPSVQSGIGRVVNLGLMADRQNGIIVGMGLAVVGAIMFALGSQNKN